MILLSMHLLSSWQDLQRLIYIQHKFYMSNFPQTKFELFFLKAATTGITQHFSTSFYPAGDSAWVEARHFERLSSAQFVYPHRKQRQSRYRRSHAINLTQVLLIASQQKLTFSAREDIVGKPPGKRKDDRLRLGLKCATYGFKITGTERGVLWESASLPLS